VTTAATQQILYRDAINQALHEEMRRDPKVIVYGEDVAVWGGIFKVTDGLLQEFGDARVRDTPISEQAIIGTAIGAAMTGLRPIVEIMFGGMMFTAFDGIFMKLGTWKHAFNLPALPVVLRTTCGGGAGPEHSLSPEALLMHSPGLKVVMPATPYDAKGLLKTAIRDDEPVVFLEHLMLYGMSGPVPTEEYLIPFGQANITREGKDVTIVTFSAMVHKAAAAAEELSKEGIEAEIIDLRTLVPLDEEAIIKSVQKTGKVVIVHEAMERAGAGGELAALISDKAFDYLDAPIKRVAALNMPLPHNPVLSEIVRPQEKKIISAVKSLM